MRRFLIVSAVTAFVVVAPKIAGDYLLTSEGVLVGSNYAPGGLVSGAAYTPMRICGDGTNTERAACFCRSFAKSAHSSAEEVNLCISTQRKFATEL